MVFGLRKVKVGGPINFQQWNLDQQVRGLRLEVDSDNDLLALPVVIVDPTQKPEVLAATSAQPQVWQWGAIDTDIVGPKVVLPVNNPGETIMLAGFVISFGGPTIAAAGLVGINVSDASANMEWNFYSYCGPVAQPLDPIVVIFPDPLPLTKGEDFSVDLSGPLVSGKIIVTAWGYYK